MSAAPPNPAPSATRLSARIDSAISASPIAWLAATLAVAAACALAGKLSFALAFPSGFASPLFLPAGIAAAVVLILGAKMLPGIFVGYLLYLGWIDAASMLGPHAALAITLLAAGACLQALTVCWLLRRFGGFPGARGAEHPALRQVLLAGPVASVVSPSVGVTTLYAVGAIGADDVAFNWMTWWVGDSLGAALAGPVVTVLLVWTRSRRQRVIASFVLPMTLTIAFVGMAIHEIAQRDLRQVQATFEREVLFVSNTLFARFDTVLMALEALNGLFTASESVTRNEFNRFVDPWVSSIPMIQAIGWSQRVLPEEIPAHESSMRADGAPGYVVFDRQQDDVTSSPAPANEYIVVSYVSPTALNANVQGLNQLSFPETREAILAARLSGATRSSAPFRLLQRGPGSMGVVLFRALPTPGEEIETPAPASNRPHQGAVFVSLYLRNSFNDLPIDRSGAIRVCLFDVTDRKLPRHLAGQPDCASRAQAYSGGQLVRSIDRNFGERQWQLRVEAAPSHLRASRNRGSWILSVLGLLGASMLGVFLLTQIDRQRQFQREVEARSRELASETREREAAQSANRAKSEFLSRMSHELRTPLNAVLGFAQLLAADRDSPLSAMQLERIALIEKAGWHLRDMIDEVLDLARIEAGASNLRLERVDALKAVDECRSMLGAEAQSRGLELRQASGLRSEPLFVHADPTRLRQILLNLVGNAIKYTEAGHVELRVSRRGSTEVAISVVDSGPGLTDAQMARLFVPFDRLGRERTSAGTGIGLVISRQLVEAMGGRLEVDSAPGRGSRFTAILPADRSGGGADDLGGSALPSGSARSTDAPDPLAQGSASRPIVVCIEDNPLNAALFRDAIASAGELRFEHRARADEGIAAIRELRAALVILDLNLPDCHGLDVLAELRADPLTRDVAIVVVSADATSATRERALSAGANAFVPKPLDLAAFSARVREMLVERRASGNPDSGRKGTAGGSSP